MTIFSKNQTFLWALLATGWYAVSGAKTCTVADAVKTDCGFTGVDQASCEARGCCWGPSMIQKTPACYYSGEIASGYTLTHFQESTTGFVGILNLIGDGTSVYGPDVKQLKLEVIFENADVLRIKISDAQNSRWEIPQSVINRSRATAKPDTLNYKFSYTSSPFTFEVTRLSDGASIFKLDDSFTFKDQYLEVTTSRDAKAKTFGLGESTRLHQALETGKTYTLWNNDLPAFTLYHNLYGAYPFYLEMLNGKAHGAMLMNSNGMDIDLQDNSLTYKSIGGIVDLYVFSGSTPAEVVSQYTSIVGRPAMMPYWSFGFHNCKWGYTSLQEVQEIVANYSSAGIPLDTQWFDIDYMQNYRDFTYDSAQFPQAQVAEFVEQLHAKGQHFVPIVDPGIMTFAGYEAYDRGVKEGLFIKDIQGNDYLGQVWPGPTHFPDFLHPNTQSYWTDQMKDFLALAPADGIWIDMNEVSNFCNRNGHGQVCVNPGNCPRPSDNSQVICCLECSTVDETNPYDFPPYHLNNFFRTLSGRTIAMSSTQYGNVTHYDAHNLYGLTEQMATNKALKDIRGKRPFVLSRSSFMSTGVHSAKWTGDNAASWNDLKSSIVSIMDFNLFGVPMIGADICGFDRDTTEELCARWIEVGAFYSFSRAHNANGMAPQEIYRWDSVAEAGRNALAMRYQLLPYLNTLFYQAHTQGSTVIRSLWLNFPEDEVTLTIDHQFMWGNKVLISPVVERDRRSVDAYFPTGYWYDFADHSLAVDASTGGVWKTLAAPLTKVNVHVKGGSILPLQQAAMTTTEGRTTPFTLIVAFCPKGKAYGDLYWDDGEQINVEKYLSVSYEGNWMSGSGGSVTSSVSHNTYLEAKELHIEEIVIMGKSLGKTSTVTLNGKELSDVQVFTDREGAIHVKKLHVSIASGFVLEWK